MSRSAFYKHFRDKHECFLAAIEALLRPAVEYDVRGARPKGEPPTDADRTRRPSRALTKVYRSPPRRPCASWRSTPGGSEAVALLDRATASLEDVARRVLDGMGREGMPSEIVRALIGGSEGDPQAALPGQARGAADLAPQLWEWLFLYPPPPGPLRGPRRRVLRPLPFEERQAASNPPERLLRALAAVVAEKGYPETTITDIIERAGMSYRASTSASTARRTRSWRPWTSARCRCSRRRYRPSGGQRTGRMR